MRWEWEKRKGQALLEYAMIIVLVILVVIAVLALLGPGVVQLYNNVVANWPAH